MATNTIKKNKVCCAAWFLTLLLATGNAAAEKKRFNIDAQPLAKALLQFNRQSGLTVAAPTDLVESRHAPAVRGEMEPYEALKRILDGSGLKPTELPSGAYTITLVSADLGSSSFRMAQYNAEQEATTVPRPGRASSSMETSIEIIVVTARKREELAIDVPASINVVQGEEIQASGMLGVDDLQYRTPGLVFSREAGATRVSLRGVGTNLAGTGASPSVAVHIDGVYVPRTAVALGELFDIERFEVLKGPEGTLYGRNATGGAINLLSRDPGDTSGVEGYIGYGNYDLLTAQLATDIIASDRGGLRISGLYANDEGYTDNVNAVGGEIDARDYLGLRVRGRYEFTDTTYGALTVQYVNNEGTVSFGGTNNPDTPNFAGVGPQRTGPRDINVDTPPANDQEAMVISGEFGAKVGNVEIRSITGYVDFDQQSKQDVDAAGAFIAFNDVTIDSEFFSQEFQLSSTVSDKLFLTGGLYFSKKTL